jgi:hypothetical protein
MIAPIGVFHFYYNGLEKKPAREKKRSAMASFDEKFRTFGKKAMDDLNGGHDNAFNPKLFMNRNLATQLIFSTAFAVVTYFVAHFSTIGFQVVSTAVAYILFALGAVFVVNKQQDAVSVGVCIGSGAVIALLSLVTAVYWGELTKCTVTTETINEYSCENKPAMRAICAFAAILFVLQVCSPRFLDLLVLSWFLYQEFLSLIYVSLLLNYHRLVSLTFSTSTRPTFWRNLSSTLRSHRAPMSPTTTSTYSLCMSPRTLPGVRTPENRNRATLSLFKRTKWV